MRILSLLPAATEIVYLLGLEKYLVWDPKLTSSSISNAMTSLEIDMAVKRLGHRGNGVFHIDQKKVKELKPDLILTQELCSVCAISFTEIEKAARILDSDVKIISLEPESVEDILENILLVGKVTNRLKVARKLVTRFKARIKKLITRNKKTNKRPKVLVVEWLDPLMVAGHWVPEMVEIAGGQMLITKRGEKSRRIKQAQLNLNPDILIIAPCGFDIVRTIQESKLIDDLRLKINDKKTKDYLMDGNAFLTRPGPRIVDGIEILAEILHPEIFKRKHTKNNWDVVI